MRKTILIFLLFIRTISFSQTNTFPSSGNVGIGTTTPVNLLEVQRDQDAGTFMVVRNAASSTSAYTGIRANSQNQSVSIMANSDGFSRPYPGFHTSSVAILGDAANGLNIISDAGGTTPGPNAGMIRFITYASPGGVTTTVAGNDALTRMVIDGSGKIGIGTITPSEKLSVAGNIRTQKVIVTQLGWSDYVFDSSYQLKPLTEVEQFIKQNKHLPDIPSAIEVEEKGVSVGDNQALLLKKIEELTLYMIEMKKENKKQQEEIEMLKSKLNINKSKQKNK
jgi:hypothetical protein